MIGLVELQKALEQKAKSLRELGEEKHELDNELRWMHDRHDVRKTLSEKDQTLKRRKLQQKWVSLDDALRIFDETLAEKVSVDRKQLSELWAKQPPFPMNVTYRGSLEEWLENLKELLEARGKDEK